jgi:hypothetical protein
VDRDGIAPRRVLVLYWMPKSRVEMRAAIRHHIEAVKQGPSNHQVTFWNACNGTPALVRRAGYDAVILHTTLLCLRWFPDFAAWRDKLSWLRALDCLKIAMPQDEYDHSEILDEWLSDLGVEDVFSNFAADARTLLYPRLASRARFEHAFTGYIDESTARSLAARLVAAGGRPLDVVYRASHLPYWFGSLGQLKHRIGEHAQREAAARGLTADVSTHPDDAIMGDEWFDFLAAGRVVVGCESGSSVLDRRGEIKNAIREELKSHPDASFEQVATHMPDGWDSYHFGAISPRHFEAVITRTCQVLVEGRYDGVLVSGRHYVPVRPDLADLGEALQKASDPACASEMAERTYEEIYRSGRYTYRVLAEQIDRVLETRPPGQARLDAGLSALAARFGSWQLHRPGGVDAARAVAPLKPASRLSVTDAPGALRGRVGRRLLGAYLRAGRTASSIPAARLLSECRLLNQVWKAQRAAPRTPAFRAVKAVTQGTALELSILRRAPNATQPAAHEENWPPRSIAVREPSFRSGDKLNAGERLEAVCALAVIRPRLVQAALRPLLDDIGGAKARPGAGGLRGRLKTLLATGRVLLDRPGDASILTMCAGRSSVWDAADDVVKLWLLRVSQVRATVEPATGTMWLMTAPAQEALAGPRIPAETEIKRIVWDNSGVADHAVLPLLGRRMTVFLGARGVHEFTAIEALPRSARESILRGLES